MPTETEPQSIVKTIRGEQVEFFRIPKNRAQIKINWAKRKQFLLTIHHEIQPKLAQMRAAITD